MRGAATRKAGFTPPSAINHRAASSRAPSCRSTHQRGKPTRPLTSNRLSGINLATGGTRAYAYDAAGNVVSDSRGAGYAYTYDAAGRMATMSINGVLQGSYKYDFAGRQAVRTLTSPTAVTIHSVFDSNGRRVAEYNEGTGALIREYVWMGWEPIAVIEGGVVSFIRTDHIGRPVFATNAAGVKVWTASYTPFGGVRTTTGTPINARFPGQWFQSESGLHQNWMRDYDPTTGRYLQADPLELVDGASVYGYAGQSPLMYTDMNGMRSLRLGGTTGGYSPWIGPGSPTAPDYSGAWDELLGLSHDYNPIDLLLQSIVEACTTCPACSPYTAGTIGYRWDNHFTNAPGVGSSHLNLYIVRQNPTNCKCFWNANNPYHVNPPPNPSWIFLPSTGRYGSRTSFPPLSP